MAKFVAGISSSFLQVVKSIGKQSNISSNLLIQQYYKNSGNMKRKEFEIRTERPTKNKPSQLSGFCFIIYMKEANFILAYTSNMFSISV